MKATERTGLALAVALLAAGALQTGIAGAVRVRLAEPALLLLIVLLGSIFCEANGGAALGFCAGVAAAAIAAPPVSGFGSIIVSYTLVGFGVGWLEQRVFRDQAGMAVLLAAAGTPLALCLFFVFDPQRHVAHWAACMLGATLYNSLLALPVFLLLRLGVAGRRPRGA